jgi:thiamine pyrophosphokinase
MRAILVGPVQGTSRQEKAIWDSLQIQDSDLKIGVDGGSAIWLKHGYLPNFCVGDWDSLKNPKKILDLCIHITLPTDKDRSDLFFAVLAALEAGATEILCVGVTGGRPDHHFAMLSDLSIFSLGKYGDLNSIEARGPEAAYFFLSKKIPAWKAKLKLGQLVSLFSMSEVSSGISLIGFEYPLKNAKLAPSSRGLSNCVKRKSCEIRIRQGRMLVVVPGWVSA